MKYFKILIIFLTIQANVFSQQLTIVDQDYDKAKAIALKENKLILIDFYTTWCAPCKKLDKLIFQNDTLSQRLGIDFVLLRYNAENDSVFNLSKKHHIVSYPTGIILNKEGYVLDKKYGFIDKDLESLGKDYFNFTTSGIQLNKENKTIKGYSNEIKLSIYPQFYKNAFNKKKIDSTEFRNYWKENNNIFSEEYFSTVLYYALDIPDNVSNTLLNNRIKYEELYGNTDVSGTLFLLAAGKFEKAISHKNQKEFDKAIEFTNEANSKEDADKIIRQFRKSFLLAQNRWREIIKINETLKKDKQFSDNAVNSFSWDVYEKCHDKKVVIKCVQWMKELTDKKPDYSYLDTYACILYKSGDIIESKRIVKLAIETGKKNNENTSSTENFLKTLQ